MACATCILLSAVIAPFATQATNSYIVVQSSQTCEGEGYYTIKDAADCKAAAIALGQYNLDAFDASTSYGYAAPGCLARSGTPSNTVNFNTDFGSTQGCNAVARGAEHWCLCRSTTPPSTPVATATAVAAATPRFLTTKSVVDVLTDLEAVGAVPTLTLSIGEASGDITMELNASSAPSNVTQGTLEWEIDMVGDGAGAGGLSSTTTCTAQWTGSAGVWQHVITFDTVQTGLGGGTLAGDCPLDVATTGSSETQVQGYVGLCMMLVPSADATQRQEVTCWKWRVVVTIGDSTSATGFSIDSVLSQQGATENVTAAQTWDSLLKLFLDNTFSDASEKMVPLYQQGQEVHVRHFLDPAKHAPADSPYLELVAVELQQQDSTVEDLLNRAGNPITSASETGKVEFTIPNVPFCPNCLLTVRSNLKSTDPDRRRLASRRLALGTFEGIDESTAQSVTIVMEPPAEVHLTALLEGLSFHIVRADQELEAKFRTALHDALKPEVASAIGASVMHVQLMNGPGSSTQVAMTIGVGSKALAEELRAQLLASDTLTSSVVAAATAVPGIGSASPEPIEMSVTSVTVTASNELGQPGDLKLDEEDGSTPTVGVLAACAMALAAVCLVLTSSAVLWRAQRRATRKRLAGKGKLGTGKLGNSELDGGTFGECKFDIEQLGNGKVGSAPPGSGELSDDQLDSDQPVNDKLGSDEPVYDEPVSDKLGKDKVANELVDDPEYQGWDWFSI